MECVTQVAGKVIMIENLHDDINEAYHFRDFFANVYCQAYVNSLVTTRDGLSQIFPGGLDGPIEDALLGISDGADMNMVDLEMTAVSLFVQTVEAGQFEMDESSLIDAVEPVAEAMAIYGAEVQAQAVHAMLDRGDYLNDFNFLRFLLDF